MTDLTKDSDEHREAEALLRKKKERSEADLTSCVLMYDKDMAEKQAAIEELEQKKKEEMALLQQLEEHFRKIDANNAKQSDEEKTLKEFKKRIQDASSFLDLKATKIQALARGMQTRTDSKRC